MMKAANFGKCNNLSHLCRLDRPAIWRILPKRKMATASMIIVEVRNHVAPERGLIQDYEVIETLSANRADQPFNVWALPWRAECSEHFSDFHTFGLRPEGSPIDAVAIAEQEARGLVPGKCLEDLGCSPLSSWMLGDVEMNNAPAIMSESKKHIQDLKSHGGNHEEVNGNQLFNVVIQEGPPRLGRRLPMLHHIFRNRGLGNLDSKLEQFGVQPWSSPQGI